MTRLEDSNERKIQEHVAEALDSKIKHDVVIEHKVKGEGDNYFIDIAIPRKQIAIECKKAKPKLLKQGVGQCVRYELDGWSSYLCTHVSVITQTVTKMCMRADIGLIAATELTLGTGNRIEVYIEKDSELPATEHGYVVKDNKIYVHEMLDVMEINSMKDIMELQEQLRRLKPEIYDKTKYRDIRQRRDILPET